MKYKLTSEMTITLAGVASYDASHGKAKKKSPKEIKFDFEIKMPSKEDLKEMKEKFSESAKSFKDTTKKAFNTDSINNFMGEFFNDFGNRLEHWGKNFEKEMNNFGNAMDDWGRKFGETMEAHWNNNSNASDYSDWELITLYNELYQNNEVLQAMDMDHNIFYEVQAYDLETSMNDSLTFVGSRIENNQTLPPYQFVTQELKADQWLILKLTPEEFEKDWMKSAEKIDEISDFDIDPFFIIRHVKDKTDDTPKKVKIYLPLKERKNES